jgi:DNA-binding response OmpR family regulator
MNEKTSQSTLLIVDDVEITLEVLSQFLEEKGFNVLLASNGQKALNVTEQVQPDLILLDVMMPDGLSGFEVCKQLKSKSTTQDIPIIFMTALTETSNKIKGFEFGAADYVTKPFQYEELLARINTHLKIRQLQQEVQVQNELLKHEMSRIQRLETARQQTHKLLEHTIKQQGPVVEVDNYKTQLDECRTKFDAFVHSVSSDLKAPLNRIVELSSVFTNMGLNKAPLSVKSLVNLQQIGEIGLNTVNTVDTLLLLAGLFQEQEVKLELNEMHDIVTFVLEERLACQIQQYKAKIKLAEIWPVVPGYRPWLEEIWKNFISNGLKYGGKLPHLELGATPLHHDKVRFWVRDNGPGLTKDEQEKLFLPKTPLHQVAVKEYGLGLSVVQQLVEQMGGEVGVESKKGKGCLFYFTLPAYK